MKSMPGTNVLPMPANPQAAVRLSHVTPTEQGRLANAGV
jgi:hypothetical protein